MVPARNLLRRHYDSYGGGFFDVDAHCSSSTTTTANTKPLLSSSSLRSNPMMMAEHQQQQTGVTQETTRDREQQEAAAAAQQSDQQPASSSSTRQQQPPPPPHASWLQLGLPSSSSSSTPAAASSSAVAGPSSGPAVELRLFSDRPSSSSSLPPTVPRPMAAAAQFCFRPPWGFWTGSPTSMSTAGSSSNLMMLQPHFYNVQRFPLPPPPPPFPPPSAAESGPHFRELRVVGPPERRQAAAGVWFLLKAAENQVREPFLPQIPKSYIRIKDGRMTVRLLMKYLVKKLGLHDESEVQISCRGQLLLPFLTLQHVRDHVWCLSEAVAFLQDSPSTDHVMTLQYGRSP